MLKVALVLLVCIGLALADIPEHLVKTLPGYEGELQTRQYSGYITVDKVKGIHMHYWFVLSEGLPTTSSIVMWLNGGPGCSSMEGLFYENGPIQFADAQQKRNGVPALVDNVWRWNQESHMLYLESPAGVGFSYADDTSVYNVDDVATAKMNYAFLEQFFLAFPEFASNPFFIAGESYAGIYVPTLAEQIMNNENKINLQGILVGNGCVGGALGVCSRSQTDQIRLEYCHSHGLLSDVMWADLTKTCTDWAHPSAACTTLIGQAHEAIGRVNIYNIYGECILGAEGSRKVPFDDVVGGPLSCIDAISGGEYLNDPTVRTTIHVASESAIGKWSVCSDKLNYTTTTPSEIELYKELSKHYRIMIYNGDADACVPFTDNQAWINMLGFPVKEAWRPWTLQETQEQVGGYITSYDAPNEFYFVTVKGAGHMVPQTQPIAAFQIFYRFIDNVPF